MNSKQMKNVGIVEAYLPIDGFESYEVSNYGNVKTKVTDKILKPGIDKYGYSKSCFTKQAVVRKTFIVPSGIPSALLKGCATAPLWVVPGEPHTFNFFF